MLSRPSPLHVLFVLVKFNESRIIRNDGSFEEKLDSVCAHMEKGMWHKYPRSFNKRYLLQGNYNFYYKITTYS